MAACDDKGGGSGPSSSGGSSSGGGSGGNTGSGGGLTITDFPSDYNGKYARVAGSPDRGSAVLGYQRLVNGSYIYPRISNGTVTIPLWVPTAGGGYVRYSGNDTFGLGVSIYNSEDGTGEAYSIGGISNIPFSNGNATVSWQQ